MRIPTSTFAATHLPMWVLLSTGIAAGVIWASRFMSKRARHSRHMKPTLGATKTLEDSFSASDAPATRNHSIPINAR
jgi:hypothetical protein